MKLSITHENNYYDSFEKIYGENVTGQFARLFEYAYSYRIELLKKLSEEQSMINSEIYKSKIVDIEKILEDHIELVKFLRSDALAL